MKYCVVTMLFNKYDLLHEPLDMDSEADYYCITDDKNLISNKWKIVYLSEFDTSLLTGIQKTHRFKNQIYKYIPNVEKYDYIVRLDGSISIYKSLKPIVEYINRGKYDLSIAPHPWRNNIIDEYLSWEKERGLDPKFLYMFINACKNYDYSLEALCETSFQIYRNCKEVFNFLDDVYKIMNTSSNEEYLTDPTEQMFYTYILYKHKDKLRINFHPATLYRYSKYMKVNYHNSEIPFHNEPVNCPRRMKFFDDVIYVNKIEDYENLINFNEYHTN